MSALNSFHGQGPGTPGVADMRNASRFCKVLLATLCLVVAGCSGGGKLDDLRSYVNHVRATQKGHIKPLPTFKPFETFAYTDSSAKDPFEPWSTESKLANGGNGVHPNFHRRKEALEAFPLDSLHMVGTLDFNNTTWAAVKAPDGIVYRIKAGGYMGQNNGKVTKIGGGKVMLREIVPNGLGGWEKRPAFLALNK